MQQRIDIVKIKSKPFFQSRITPQLPKDLAQPKPQHMKKESKLNSAARSSFALAIWHPNRALSREHAKMLERCHELNVLKRKMNVDLKTQVAELAQYIARMKRAPEEKKFSLMNAFLTHMAEQQIAMNARQAALQDEMTTHMILHMQVDKESALNCAALWGNQ